MRIGKKRLVSLILCMLMLLSVMPLSGFSVSVSDFTDVKESHWAYDYIDYMVEQGAYSGVSANSFAPNAPMTRAMFVTVLARIAGAEVNNSGPSGFADVKSGKWYTGSIAWAKENGIVKGISATQFGPDNTVTREQAATIISNFINCFDILLKSTVEVGDAFTDAKDISAFATDAVALCRLYGIISGYSDGSFRPKSGCSRAESCAMLYRLLDNMPENIILEDASDTLYSDVNLTVTASGAWTVTDNTFLYELELEEGATVTADYPVVIEFTKSDTVSNGQIIGNVQFISDYDEVVAIVHTNDIHGYIDIEPYVKGYADSLKESGDYSLVLTVSAGDVFAGGYGAAHIYQGEFIPAIMAKTYDAMTIGNNDFGLTGVAKQVSLLCALGESMGMTPLLANLVATSNYDMVAYAKTYVPTMGSELFTEIYSAVSLNGDGSLDWSGLGLENYSVSAGDYILDPTTTYVTSLGTKVGLYGISTSGGAASQQLTGTGSITTSQSMATALREEDDCTVVVGICHTGWPDGDSTLRATSSNDTNSAQIALNTTGIDALVDGHTHSIINGGKGWMGGTSNTFVNQACAKGEAIGVMYLYIKDGAVIASCGDNLTDVAGITPDAEVQALVDKTYGKLESDEYLTVIAESEYFLNGERSSTANIGGGVRLNETNLGDLVADAVLTMSEEITGKDIDIALFPGYWVRSSIAAGPISKFEVSSVFANVLQVFYTEYTAKQLVSAMNTSIATVGKSESTSFCQISGFTVEYYSTSSTKNAVYSITVGDTLIYENGVYLVDDAWSCSVAITLCGADAEDPVSKGWSLDDQIIASKEEMADAFCEYMVTFKPTILPNTIAPGSRITLHN